VQRIFFPNFPKFAEQLLCDKLSPYTISVVVGTFYFPLTRYHKQENKNLVLGIWFFNNPIEKSMLGCERKFSEATWFSNML